MALCLVAIPTPPFGAIIVILEVDANFLAYPLWSPPCPSLVVVALGVQDVVWRSVGEAVSSIFCAILASYRIFILFFVFTSPPTCAVV